MTPLTILLAVAAFAADTPPMLANGGFEQLQGERPVRWDIFIAPYPQASVAPALPTARISREAQAGDYCAVLETPLQYPNEPYNNWSQNIIGRYGGQRLRVSGWIKTENADGAAIWVQCWRRDPLRVAHVANTGDTVPIYGTTDWQQVSLEFDVPEQTSFLTLRCVLKGGGKAWFDEVILEPAPEPEPEPEAIATPEKPTPPTPPVADADATDAAEPASPKAEPAVAAEVEAPATMVESPDPEFSAAEDTGAAEEAAAEPSTAEAPVAPPDTAAIEAEIARLREANAALNGALGAVQSDNRELLKQLATLQEQLVALQEALKPAGAARSGQEQPPTSASAPPPLVPRDYKGDAP